MSRRAAAEEAEVVENVAEVETIATESAADEAGAEAVSQVRGETDPRPGVAPVVDRDHDAGN